MEQDYEDEVTTQYRKVLSRKLYRAKLARLEDGNYLTSSMVRKAFASDNRIVTVKPWLDSDDITKIGYLVRVVEFEWTDRKVKPEPKVAQPKVVKSKPKAFVQKGSTAPKVHKVRGGGSTLATRVVKSKAKPLTPEEFAARQERLRLSYNYTR